MLAILKGASILTLGFLCGGVIGIAWLFSVSLTSGALELYHWNKVVISNHSVLFFAVLMTIAGFGGYISSKVKRKDLKVGILLVTYTFVFGAGFAMQNSLPFRF